MFVTNYLDFRNTTSDLIDTSAVCTITTKCSYKRQPHRASAIPKSAIKTAKCVTLRKIPDKVTCHSCWQKWL